MIFIRKNIRTKLLSIKVEAVEEGIFMEVKTATFCGFNTNRNIFRDF